MADNNQNKAEQYRQERKARLAKAAKKNAKNIEKKTAVRSAIKKVIAIVLVAAIALSCVAGILNYTGVLASLIKVGGVKNEKISIAQYKYYYSQIYNQFYQQEYYTKAYYQSDTGSGYDVTLTPEEQTTKAKDEDGKEISWVEYFRKNAVELAQSYLTYYQKAKDNKLELDKSDLKEIDDQIEELRESADKAGKQNEEDNIKGFSLNAYLRKQYGNGITENFLKKQMKIEALAKKYIETQTDSKKESYTDDKIAEVFNADPDSYQFVDLRLYNFPVEALEAKENEKDDELAKRQEKADKKLKEDAEKMSKEVKTESDFIKYVKNLNKDDASFDADASTKLVSYKKTDTSNSGNGLSSISTDLADWAFNAKTKKNAVKMFEIKGQDGNVTAYTVALLTNPKHDVDTVSVRHILFATVDTENNNAPLSDDEIKKAKANADKTFKEWKDGDKTEDSFADLARELSEDPGSQSNGGLYENICPGQMTTEFNDWIFDANRKEGDCEIVETSLGYHIIYFVNKDGSYKDNTIRANLATEEIQAEGEKLLDSDEFKVNINKRVRDYAENDLNKRIAKQVKQYAANLNSAANYGY